MKPWIFYVIIVWQVTPLSPVEQKTLILEFTTQAECVSIAEQVVKQVKKGAPFSIKRLECFRCTDIYRKDQCAPLPTPKVPLKIAPKAAPQTPNPQTPKKPSTWEPTVK